MNERIITFVISVFMVLAKFVWDIIKGKLNEKMRVRVEEIAVIVEALYDGATSTEKLKAFEALCEKKGLNVKKAVKYLETNIIPISKQINSYIIADKKKDKTEVTN
ncbi:MAG: hypothetical protein GX963_15865 [Bacteroidales bacterium]|nr:hypothetical protein [Bacteroidales bacterium]